jgi:Na+-translocating ferredoxin:NAD+ oxidoreductase RNF subunit RnfB
MALNNGNFTTKQYRAYSLYLYSVAVRYYIYHCVLAVQSRAVVITVASLEMLVACKALRAQCSYTVTPCNMDVVHLQACCASQQLQPP